MNNQKLPYFELKKHKFTPLSKSRRRYMIAYGILLLLGLVVFYFTRNNYGEINSIIIQVGIVTIAFYNILLGIRGQSFFETGYFIRADSEVLAIKTNSIKTSIKLSDVSHILIQNKELMISFNDYTKQYCLCFLTEEEFEKLIQTLSSHKDLKAFDLEYH